ncbi:NfeD family protein [Flavihumibacter solisilvae]|uniref:Serine protease n=1 Tax=Flavihumibacter solisilvae TaxID=1349421 RepID=A0A0C1IYM5_9BACT|nr:nodulation protein NfeD [Flavihumibacter solisilvae]KIC95574.1 serine protease [Flavihumibacter solisilvae]
MIRFILITLIALASYQLQAQKVLAIKVDGAINPVATDYIQRGIKKATDDNASCLLIQLNTPGGLLKSTRVIVQSILESPVPVIVYISPGGAHAGSAGVFITMGAHIAAMAPGTNIGAAHPVTLQGAQDSVMSAKATNDAAAFIRSIANQRNRNLEWAEQAVRESQSITEKEALEKNVIDVVATDVRELLAMIDGKVVQTSSGKHTLHTTKSSVEYLEMGFVDKLLDLLSDPNIAYIMLLIGFYGILFELYNPGAIFPGVAGGICLILAFYTLHTLPINYAGLALIIFAVILYLLEIKIVSHGILAIGGTVALLMGSMMLLRNDSPLEYVRISLKVIIPSIVITALFFLFVVGAGLRAQRSKPVTGPEGLIGETGESLEELNPSGMVRVHGEIWQAESVSGSIGGSVRIRVTGIKDLRLFVEPLHI